MITRSNERERKEKVMAQRFEIFNKENLGSIRTAVVDGEPWFRLKDVCKILGLSNITEVKKRLNGKGLSSIEVLTNGGKQQALYIDEPNLYKAIMQSRKEEAEVFSDWIFYEVIPSIRKHGYYSNIPQINEKDVAMLSIIKAGSEEERSIAFSKYQERFVLPMQKELEMARPKVQMYNEFLDAEGTANTTMIAKSFGLSSGRLLNEIMHFEGFIVKIGNGWGPSKRYVDAGIMKPIEFNYNNHKVSVKSAETNDDENKKLISNSNETLPVPANETAKKAETAELTVIEEENKANHQGKGLTFRWTMNGIETIKEVLLSEDYIVRNGNVYSGNNETLKEFKKKYKEWKEKK